MASTVWMFAKEFGWTAEYILWGISEAEINQLEHSILIKKGFKVMRLQNREAEKLVDDFFDDLIK